MNRRQVLAVLGAGTTGLAGCNRTQRNETATPTPTEPSGAATTPTASPTATLASDRDLKVSFDALQPAYVDLSVDNYRMVSEPDTQYFFLAVEVESGLPPALSDFGLRFDGTDYSPLERDTSSEIIRNRARDESWSIDDRYLSGWIVFELPETGDASDVNLTWPGGGWRPDRDTLERLAAPLPSLSLVEWHVPETAREGSHVTFGFTVSNDTDLPGHFVGAINASDSIIGPHHPVAVVSREISPNDTESWEVVGDDAPPIILPDDLPDDVKPTVTYEFVWAGGGPVKQSVEVVKE